MKSLHHQHSLSVSWEPSMGSLSTQHPGRIAHRLDLDLYDLWLDLDLYEAPLLQSTQGSNYTLIANDLSV